MVPALPPETPQSCPLGSGSGSKADAAGCVARMSLPQGQALSSTRSPGPLTPCTVPYLCGHLVTPLIPSSQKAQSPFRVVSCLLQRRSAEGVCVPWLRTCPLGCCEFMVQRAAAHRAGSELVHMSSACRLCSTWTRSPRREGTSLGGMPASPGPGRSPEGGGLSGHLPVGAGSPKARPTQDPPPPAPPLDRPPFLALASFLSTFFGLIACF